MYAIETKEGNPDLREVQAQIQYCLDEMQVLLQSTSDTLRVVRSLRQCLPWFGYASILWFQSFCFW
jgi:hypothetical protein